MTQNRIFHAGDSPLAGTYNEAALRSHLEGLFAIGAIPGASDQDAVEGAITKLIAHPYKLFRFGLLNIEFRPDQQPKPFVREDRYIVVKRSDLEKIPSQRVVNQFLAALAELNAHSCRIPQRQFVVVESDWPEYAATWAAIEARVTGAPKYTDEEQAYIDAAREQFHKDGDLEADDYPLPHLHEGGAYVQMWKWVPDSLVDLPEEDDNAQD